jgi:hypothetical protein
MRSSELNSAPPSCPRRQASETCPRIISFFQRGQKCCPVKRGLLGAGHGAGFGQFAGHPRLALLLTTNLGFPLDVTTNSFVLGKSIDEPGIMVKFTGHY